DALGAGNTGQRYLLAATFGNVHGVYKPGNVKLKPEILKMGQDVAVEKLGLKEGDLPVDFVFHGGSGSAKSEIEEALSYGVIKMNVDTDTQNAFTRPIASHMFGNYDGVLKVDGDVGNKKVYDPRSYLKKAEQAMSERDVEACNDLRSAGKSPAAKGSAIPLRARPHGGRRPQALGTEPRGPSPDRGARCIVPRAVPRPAGMCCVSVRRAPGCAGGMDQTRSVSRRCGLGGPRRRRLLDRKSVV